MSRADKVTLTLNIDSIRDEDDHGILVMLFDIILSAFAFSGFGGIFIRMTGIAINQVLVFLSAVITCFILLLPLRRFNILRKLLPAFSVVVMSVLLWYKIADGFIYTANNIIDILGGRFLRIIPHLKLLSMNTINAKTAQTVFLIAISILISYSIVFSLKHKDIIIPIILSVLTISLCIVFEFSPPFLYICPASLYVLGIMLKRLSDNKAGAIGLTLCTVLCIITCLFLSALSFKNVGNWFKGVRSDIIADINTFRYGESSVMPEGNFTDLESFTPSGNKQLEVIMSNSDSVYLKGFVGEEYNGTGWSMIDADKRYENADLFYWLHKSDLFGQNQLSFASQLYNPSEAPNKITINNKGASRKYIYYPYEMISSQSFDHTSLSDGIIPAKGFSGENLYTIDSLGNQVKYYPDILKKIKENINTQQTKDYLKLENNYREFVYKYYLDIPEESQTLLRSQLGEYSASKSQRMSYENAQQNILSYLSKKVSYNADVAFSRKNGDFLQYFLEQSCEGYSVHYATASALIFRYYGIPARYVEGYLITPDDVKNAVPDSALNIDDSHFHAWVEFYRDGIGWIPFESTPPYLNMMEKAEEISVLPDKDTSDNASQNNNDNLEKSKHGEMQSTEINERSIRFFMIFALIAFVAFFFTLIIICAFRRIALLNKFRAFDICDNKSSVLLAFSYITSLLKRTGNLKSENELYAEDSNLYTNCGNLSDRLKTSLEIYDKANFSKHTISNSEKQYVLDTLNDLIIKIKNSNNLMKNIYCRFIKCWYI